MARPLLVPTAFFTLVGLAPSAFAAEDTCTLEATAVARSGNARTPSYDDGMINRKAAPNLPSGVVITPVSAEAVVVVVPEAPPATPVAPARPR